MIVDAVDLAAGAQDTSVPMSLTCCAWTCMGEISLGIGLTATWTLTRATVSLCCV